MNDVGMAYVGMAYVGMADVGCGAASPSWIDVRRNRYRSTTLRGAATAITRRAGGL